MKEIVIIIVEIDDEYANRICGLCGDFNGQQISPITFGNGWKTASPINCEDLTEAVQTSGKTENMTDSCKEFEIFCKDLFKNESWSSCIPLIHPEPYIQACVKDMCHCSNLNGSCVCSTLSEFSRQCSHAGGQPPNWRTPKLCAKHCPPTMVYDEYGSPCINTCRFPDTSLVCEDHNIDGCFCPPETVLDDISTGSCIPLSECPCKHDKVYKSNEVYQERGENCTCIAGKWSCESLQMHATCSVEQGSYITTFDGKDFTFHGDCDYTLAKVNNMQSSDIKVAFYIGCTQNTLKIHLNRDKNNHFFFIQAIIFTSEGRVQKNGQKVTLPYNSGDISIFHASSFHIMLQTSFGLQIQIQHVPLMQVYVSLEQSYREKTRGLCGNYNMMQSDDMRTRQGMVEGEEGTFSNSWKTDYSCKDGHGRLDDPCSLRTENEKFAKNWCPLLRQPNSTFAQCHSVVDAETYYKRCIYASCNCEKSEDCLCAVFSSFARACASKGVFLIGWRKDVCNKRTKNCPASQTFSYIHQRCQLTCRSLSSKMQSCTSDFLPVGGCSCAENHYLDDNDICVPKAKCPFNLQNIKVVPASVTACTSPKEYFNCSTADKRDVGVQCARTCSNPDNECCKSGCLCPRGLVDDGKGSCVKENQCPCQHGKKLYSSGEKISKKCNTCTCKSGKWDCTDKKCPGTCIIYGSGHYITFDENSYGFHGQMSYTVVKNTCGNKTQENNFTVIIESEICELPNPICFRKIRIHLGVRPWDVISPNGTEIQYTKRKLGFYLVVEFDIGLTVISDHKATVKIRLEPQYSGEVCGLCGNFDGNAKNDFTTQGQLVVSKPLEFANSWKLYSNFPDQTADLEACTSAPRENWAKIMCHIIKETFNECHYKVDHLPFYENCVKDACTCDKGGDCECFCTAVAAYAQACAEAGVCVAWRTPEICPVFCDYYNKPGECTWHYKMCPINTHNNSNHCLKTCDNPEGICPNDMNSLHIHQLEGKHICIYSNVLKVRTEDIKGRQSPLHSFI
uniref:Mucin-2-like n=1 Tax=Maylandia zebra TaxID=106582 RepID=A0A3P9AWU3_9CICH